jgi:hypothetical protein
MRRTAPDRLLLPTHACIDNCIHTFAGIQLRLACDALMREQGHPEPPDRRRSPAQNNLPAKYVIHTVGPIVEDEVTPRDRALLASCYRAVLRWPRRGAYEHRVLLHLDGRLPLPAPAGGGDRRRNGPACLQEEPDGKEVIFQRLSRCRRGDLPGRCRCVAAPQTEAARRYLTRANRRGGRTANKMRRGAIPAAFLSSDLDAPQVIA